MIEDSTGADVQIPAVLISKKDGQAFIDYLKFLNTSQQNLVVTLDFDFTQKEDKVTVRYYGSSDDPKIYQLISSITSDFAELHEEINFEPVFKTYEHFFIVDNRSSIAHCFSAGRYCADPNSLYNIGDGREILEENMKQKCVWEIKGLSGYFRYAEVFEKRCLKDFKGRGDSFRGYCSNDVLEEIGINAKEIDKCMSDSVKSEETFQNAILVEDTEILKNDRKKVQHSNLVFFPAITVNGVEFRGKWSEANLLEDVCASYTTMPNYCRKFLNKVNDTTWPVMGLVMTICVLINVLILGVCLWKIRDKIREKVMSEEFSMTVNNVVTNYKKLTERT